MRDPHPRVDGEGVEILRRGGVEVLEAVGEAEVRRQLGSWVFAHHPHELLRRGRALLAALAPGDVAAAIAEVYCVDVGVAREMVARVVAEP